jgi:hypothetical protein
MLLGLKSNPERIARRGIDSTALAEFDGIYRKAPTLDNEQEALKAKLEAILDGLTAKINEAKKLVKIEILKGS